MEIIGAQKALEQTIDLVEGIPTKVLLDNQAPVHTVRSGRSNSSRAAVDTLVTMRQ